MSMPVYVLQLDEKVAMVECLPSTVDKLFSALLQSGMYKRIEVWQGTSKIKNYSTV